MPLEERTESCFPTQQQGYISFNGLATKLRILYRTVHKTLIPARKSIDDKGKKYKNQANLSTKKLQRQGQQEVEKERVKIEKKSQ